MIGANIDLGPLRRVFGSIQERSGNFRDPLTEVGLMALKEFDHRFAVSGPGWPPNKRGTQTLVRTGKMRRSFTQEGDDKNLFNVGRTEATFGSKLFYAKILQTGGVMKTQAPKLGNFQRLAGLKRLPSLYVTLPPRPIVVPPSKAFQAGIGRIAFNHYRDGMAVAK